MILSDSVWLFGCGNMSQSYAKVLMSLNVPFSVFGRSSISSSKFYSETGIYVHTLPLKNLPPDTIPPKFAILAVNIENLVSVATELIKLGCQHILLEKPGSLCYYQLLELHKLAISTNCQIYIAYNRRFMSSVSELRRLVALDGGITSAFFEFTEWSHVLSTMSLDKSHLKRWVLANSSHVLDLAFNFIGLPSVDSINCVHNGSLDWHPSASVFNGSGLTQYRIPFSYCANWEAPGRWAVELLTKKYRYLLSPLEFIKKIKLGSIDVIEHHFDNSNDISFKPGLFKQCEAFFLGDDSHLCSLTYHLKAFHIYCKISNYSLANSIASNN